jgi:hypothetical protein
VLAEGVSLSDAHFVFLRECIGQTPEKIYRHESRRALKAISSGTEQSEIGKQVTDVTSVVELREQ